MSKRSNCVAAFDFDGTLSTRDNVVPFLVRVAGRRDAARAVLAGAARTSLAGRAGWSRDGLKEAVTRAVLAGREAELVDAVAEALATEIVERHLRADALERAEWHRARGDALVIVSASFANYLRPVAAHLGFDGVLATELEVDADGRLTGRLAGPNVRGPEKARRLDAWITERHDEPVTVWAYGDSSGDRELWARADHAVRVSGRGTPGRAVRNHG